MNKATSEVEFERLIGEVLDLAYGVARRLTRNGDDAEDLVLEAVLQAKKGFHTFEPGTNFKAWFLKIMTNVFYKSRAKNRRAVAEADIDELSERSLYDWWKEGNGEGDVERILEEQLGVEAISRAIDALPEEFREACAMYFLEELSYQQIADILGIPLGTVRSRLHRGRAQLQKMLMEEALT